MLYIKKKFEKYNMRKIALLVLLVSSTLQALPVGNLADPVLYQRNFFHTFYFRDDCHPCRFWIDDWSVRGGFYGDYLFQKKLTTNHLAAPLQGDHAKMSMFTNAGYLVLNLGKRVDLFGTLGQSDFCCFTHLSGPLLGGLDTSFDFSARSTFSWSAGGKFLAFCTRFFYLGLEGQYFRAKPKFSRLSIQVPSASFFEYIDWKMVYSEWQGALAGSLLISLNCNEILLSPYAALRFNRAKLKRDNIQSVSIERGVIDAIPDFTQEKNIGLAIGTTLVFRESISVTAEGRWGNEKGLHVNAQIRF